MAKKVLKKSVKKQSIKEFKAWLEGITEFQPAGWCPSAEQWSTIKDRISTLQDEIIVKETVTTLSPPLNQPKRNVSTLMNSQSDYSQPTNEFVQPSTHGRITLLPTEDGAQPEMIEYPVPVDNTGQPVIQTISEKIIATNKTYKTPHIDTSQSKYKSPFA